MLKSNADWKYNQKKCTIDDCNKPIWANSLCKYHHTIYKATENSKDIRQNRIGTLVKRKEALIKRSGIKKTLHKPAPFADFGFQNQMEMFITIWRESNKKSELSKRDLQKFYGTDFWYNCFAHILAKATYPRWKLNRDNIMLLHPEEHTIVDIGLVADQIAYEEIHKCSFFVFFDKQTELKKAYGRF